MLDVCSLCGKQFDITNFYLARFSSLRYIKRENSDFYGYLDAVVIKQKFGFSSSVQEKIIPCTDCYVELIEKLCDTWKVIQEKERSKKDG